MYVLEHWTKSYASGNHVVLGEYLLIFQLSIVYFFMVTYVLH